jgi:pyrroline-5-carboxylate reductase
MSSNIGTIGFGMMATSLIDGIIAKELRSLNQIWYAPVEGRI